MPPAPAYTVDSSSVGASVASTRASSVFRRGAGIAANDLQKFSCESPDHSHPFDPPTPNAASVRGCHEQSKFQLEILPNRRQKQVREARNRDPNQCVGPQLESLA